ncbi:MAG: hypothetical protein Q4G11_04380 [Gallicola sp.]|nr:hypothetical protein [Gallicola sp.]
MEHLYERIAYLKGLSEGIQSEEETKSGKLISEMLEVMGELVEEIEDLNYYMTDLYDYIGFDEDDEDYDDEDFEDYDEEIYEFVTEDDDVEDME